MEEIWKVHPYITKFEVSNLGNVRYTSTKKIIKPYAFDGYLLVGFFLNGKNTSRRVHRLVAECFCDNPDNKPFVNHKDCNPANNVYTNLEWVTPKENCNVSDFRQHTSNSWTVKPKRGCFTLQYSKNGELLNSFKSAEEAARSVNGNRSSISRCCKGIIKTYKGFVWKYDRTINNNRVVQLSLDGDYIRTFESASQAGRTIGCLPQLIARCCRGVLKKTHNYIWKFEKEYLSNQLVGNSDKLKD